MAFFGTSEFVGSVQNARFLRRLIAAGVRPAVVVSAPDVYGKPGTAAVKSAALEFGIPVLQPSTLNGFSKELVEREIELSLVAAYGKILPSEALAVPKFGSLNVHPSLLPRWRGSTPIQATILAGDAVTGVTIIQMDEKMDHGSVIAKREFPLDTRAWTAPALSDALSDGGADLFVEILEPWVLGKITPKSQNHEAATYSRILKKDDGHIDWSQSTEEIERMARAFRPWPGAYTFWPRGQKLVRLAVEEADVMTRTANNPEPVCGMAIEINGAFGIQTGDGILSVRRLKPEGRGSMSGAEFLRGQRDIIGAILE